MNTELINQLFTNLDNLHDLVKKSNTYKDYGYLEIEDYNNINKKSIYSAEYNGIKIDIIKSPQFLNEYIIQFQHPEKNYLIDMQFKHYNNTYNYFQTIFNQAPTANENMVNDLLTHIDFDNFIINENKKVQESIDTFNTKEFITEKNLADSLINKLSNRTNNFFDDNTLKTMVYDLHSRTHNIYFETVYENNVPAYPEQQVKKSTFENFDIIHNTARKHGIERSAQHTINFKNNDLNINFSLQFNIDFPHLYIDSDYTVTSQVIVDNKFINHPALVKEIIEKTHCYDYVEQTLKDVKFLRNALYCPEVLIKQQTEQELKQNLINTVRTMRSQTFSQEKPDTNLKK